MDHPQQVRGAYTGVDFPSSIEALLAAGPEGLTRMFQAVGALAPDQRVQAITEAEEFFGGGAGRKLRLGLRYQHPDPRLHTQLFVKFPRDFGDPLRELFSALMEPETRFALLSRQPGFPVAVPACYFADYDPQTSTGILITECIAFGQAPIEAFYDKCLDDGLPQPLAHYRALIKAVARLSGFHKAGCFGPEIDQQFPHDPQQIREHDRIPYSAAVMQQKIEAIGQFAQRFPGLLPQNIASPDFLQRFAAEAPRFLQQELRIKQLLNAKTDFIALSHWNANIDNAWFWPDAQGELEAGLLDWGSVGQMNIAQAFYGVLCACEIEFWNAHHDELLALFASEYQRNGGPVVCVEELRHHLQLYIALLGLAWMIDAPAIIESQIADMSGLCSRHDPRLRGNFLARAQLQLMTVFLNAWQTGDFVRALDRLP